MTAITKPKSAVSGWTGLIGLSGLFAAIALLKAAPAGLTPIQECFFLLTLCGGTMALYEILVQRAHRADDTGLAWDNLAGKLKASLFSRDTYIKLLGLLMSAGFFAFVWSLPIYQGEYYAPFFQFLRQYMGLIVGVCAICLLFSHAAMKDVRDGFWHLGACLIPTLRKDIDKGAIQNLALSLCVKMFFLPLMFIFLFSQWTEIRAVSSLPQDFKAFFDVSVRLLFLIDVCFSVIGYICTLRIFNAHIRRTETRWGGWVFCLICYAPFNQALFNNFLAYHDGIGWQDWLGGVPFLYVAWGSFLLLSYGIYVIATVNFGLRFSNLTYRGIITHGAYAHTKHPAYITKNISWWLEEIPFIATSLAGGLKHCVILGIVNYIYYMRAQYEERMLSEMDDKYRQYAAYMREHGIIARSRRYAKTVFSACTRRMGGSA